MVEEGIINREAVWKDFASLLSSLPLEQCPREHNPLTGRWGWRSPKNQAFKVEG